MFRGKALVSFSCPCICTLWLPDQRCSVLRLGADLKQQCCPKVSQLLSYPMQLLHLIFFCFPHSYKDITMKNTAAVNAMDVQISGELCKTSIAVSRHPTKINTSGKKCLCYFNPSQKESNFSFSLIHRCSLPHKQVLQGENTTRTPL